MYVCFRGRSFISYLDDLPLLKRRTDLPLRIPIVDKYKVEHSTNTTTTALMSVHMQDMGTVVMGRIESGVIQKASMLMLMPNKVVVVIYRIDTNGVVKKFCVGCRHWWRCLLSCLMMSMYLKHRVERQ